MLTNACKDNECQSETDSRTYGKDDTGQEIGLETLRRVSSVSYEYCDTKDAAVCCDERQEDAKCLVEGRSALLQDNLDHLYEGCNHQDEGYCLQILETERIEHIHLNEIGHDGCKREHKSHGCTHAEGGIHFLADTKEGTNAQELRQDNVINKDRCNEYKYVCHSYAFLILLKIAMR